jgi:hypothetical protein
MRPRARHAPADRAGRVLLDHRQCGELDGGGDDVMVWLACDCGAGMGRRADEGDALDVNG